MPDEQGTEEDQEQEKDDLSGKFSELNNRFDKLVTTVSSQTEEQKRLNEEILRSRQEPPEQEEPSEDDDYLLKYMMGGDHATEAHAQFMKDVDKKVEERLKVKEDESKRIYQEEEEKKKAQIVVNELYFSYPDLKDPESDLTKKAEQIMKEKNLPQNVAGASVAVAQAVKEMDVPTVKVPHGKRSFERETETDEVSEDDRTWMNRFGVPEDKFKEHRKAARLDKEKSGVTR